MKQLLSIVVPVYYGEIFLKELSARIDTVMSGRLPEMNYELILVDDRSPDDSWCQITELCAQNHQIKGVRLSRNFGQHYAITAGLNRASGDYIVVMDCDLQDRPEEIPNLWHKLSEGYDTVLGSRIERDDSLGKRLQSKIFYAVFGYLTNSKLDASIANFGIYRREVINAVLAMGDAIRFFPAMVQWTGFRQTILPIKHDCRKNGVSSYSFFKLFKLAGDSIIAFSEKPLKICMIGGLLAVFAALVVSTIYFILTITGHIKVAGYASLILSIWFLGGAQIAIIGLVGIYIGKIFNQVKERPIYIIAEEINPAMEEQ